MHKYNKILSTQPVFTIDRYDRGSYTTETQALKLYSNTRSIQPVTNRILDNKTRHRDLPNHEAHWASPHLEATILRRKTCWDVKMAATTPMAESTWSLYSTSESSLSRNSIPSHTAYCTSGSLWFHNQDCLMLRVSAWRPSPS